MFVCVVVEKNNQWKNAIDKNGTLCLKKNDEISHFKI